MNTTEDVKISTPTDREVVVTRKFDAPRALVFDAYTQPELLKRWYDAPGRSLVVCEIDLRVGGAYRFLWRGEGKSDVGMRGVHREVVRPRAAGAHRAMGRLGRGRSHRDCHIHRARRSDCADVDGTVSISRGARCGSESWPGERHAGNLRPSGRRAREAPAVAGRRNYPRPRKHQYRLRLHRELKKWRCPRDRSRMSRRAT